MEEKMRKLLVLTDVMEAEDNRALLGWAVPAEKMDDFLAAVDEAAIAAGGVSYEDVEATIFDDAAAAAIEAEFFVNRPNFDGLAD